MSTPIQFPAGFDLTGRACLVTGGGQGIGAAISRALAEAGATVLVTDLRLETAQRTAQALTDAGRKAHAAALDVTSEDDWGRVMALAKAQLGGLDVLVNNAGVFLGKPLADTTLQDLRWVMGPNVEGVFLGTRAALPLLSDPARRATSTASIINLSSVAGLKGAAGATAYCLSKGAVRLFTKACALELAPQRIRVNSVHPGLIETPMGTAAIGLRGGATTEDGRRMAMQAYPIGRLGQPEDIAAAVLYLASEASSFTTGSEVVVDGGMTAR